MARSGALAAPLTPKELPSPEAPTGSPVFLAIGASDSRSRPKRESPRFAQASGTSTPTPTQPARGSRVSPPRFPISIGKRGREIGDFGPPDLWGLHSTCASNHRGRRICSFSGRSGTLRNDVSFFRLCRAARSSVARVTSADNGGPDCNASRSYHVSRRALDVCAAASVEAHTAALAARPSPLSHAARLTLRLHEGQNLQRRRK